MIRPRKLQLGLQSERYLSLYKIDLGIRKIKSRAPANQESGTLVPPLPASLCRAELNKHPETDLLESQICYSPATYILSPADGLPRVLVALCECDHMNEDQ